jgi:hypothetical protein
MFVGQGVIAYDALSKTLGVTNGQSSIQFMDGGGVNVSPYVSIGQYKLLPNANGLQVCDSTQQTCKQIATVA